MRSCGHPLALLADGLRKPIAVQRPLLGAAERRGIGFGIDRSNGNAEARGRSRRRDSSPKARLLRLLQGETRCARSLAEASLAAFRSNGDPTHESQSLGLLGEVEYAEGKQDGGVELMQHSAALAAANDFTW